MNLAVFDRWDSYRTAIRKPLTVHSIEEVAKTIAACRARQDELVSMSISNDWQGLIPERLNDRGKPPVAGVPARQLSAEEQGWETAKKDAAGEGFRQPLRDESIDAYRAALNRHRGAKAREAMTKMQATGLLKAMA